MVAVPDHPAKFSTGMIPVLAQHLQGVKRVLDPFAGVGGIFALENYLPDLEIYALEIEPEWSMAHPLIEQGNALYLPWPENYFDAICSSCCYGNRMADHHEAKDTSTRNTYRHRLGRPLHPDNSGALQWGDRYRVFHRRAWAEAVRVLAPGGRFLLNVSDHIRKGIRQPVTDFHIQAITDLGLKLIEHQQFYTRRNRQGANHHLRVEYESIILFVKPEEL